MEEGKKVCLKTRVFLPVVVVVLAEDGSPFSVCSCRPGSRVWISPMMWAQNPVELTKDHLFNYS